MAECDVFISYSGELGGNIAEQLAELIGQSWQQAEVFLSRKHIHGGSLWESQLVNALRSASVCLIVATSDSLESPWVHFEAGAMLVSSTERNDQEFVVPLLFGVSESDFVNNAPVLKKFQFKKGLDESDLRDVCSSISTRIAAAKDPKGASLVKVTEKSRKAFDKAWPEYSNHASRLLQQAKEQSGMLSDSRSGRDLLTETFERLGSLQVESSSSNNSLNATLHEIRRDLSSLLEVFVALTKTGRQRPEPIDAPMPNEPGGSPQQASEANPILTAMPQVDIRASLIAAEEGRGALRELGSLQAKIDNIVKIAKTPRSKIPAIANMNKLIGLTEPLRALLERSSFATQSPTWKLAERELNKIEQAEARFFRHMKKE
jgi:hypothetical protein